MSMVEATRWAPVNINPALRGFRASRITYTSAISELPREIPGVATPPTQKTALGYMVGDVSRASRPAPSPDSPLYTLGKALREIELSTPSTPFTRIETSFPATLPGASYVTTAGISEGPFVVVAFHWEPRVHPQQPAYGIYQLALDTGAFVHFDLAPDGKGYDPEPFQYPLGKSGFTSEIYIDYVRATTNALRFVAADPANVSQQQSLLEVVQGIDRNLAALPQLS